LPDRQADYKRQTRENQSVDELEIPPDLSRSSGDEALVVPDVAPTPTATYSDYASERKTATAAPSGSGVLPDFENARVARDGEIRWLVVKATPEQVWPKLRTFWQQNGFLLTVEDPTLGIMVTGWAENKADIKTDFLSDSLRKVIGWAYGVPTRDQFRVRLERGSEPGTTEIYLTHRGLEEVLKDSGNDAVNTTFWQSRPTDHELEAEMLRRLLVYFGVDEQRATRSVAVQQDKPPKARLLKDRDGAAMLTVDEGYGRAWRLTGVALDRVGFAVEDRDRERGIYYVRYDDPLKEEKKTGLLAKMAFWRDDKSTENQYQVNLTGDSNMTRIVVLDQSGKRDQTETAARILSLLQEQLK